MGQEPLPAEASTRGGFPRPPEWTRSTWASAIQTATLSRHTRTRVLSHNCSQCRLQGLRLKDADSGGATPGQHQPRGPRHWNARREADNCCLCPRSAMSPLFISFCLCWTLPSGSHRGLCQLLEGDATRGLTMQRAGGRWPSQAHEESEIVAENICLQGDRKNEDEMPRANVPRDKSQPPSRVPSGRTVFEF